MNSKYFKGTNLEELKKEYKRLAMQYHPDRPGGSVEIMQAINNEYELLCYIYSKLEKEEHAKYKEALKYRYIISKIINLDITIEVVGSWIWVSGNTYPVKSILKEAGFYWASKKKMWYYRPEDQACRSNGKKSYQEIKQKYGSTTVKKATNNKKNYIA